MSASGHYQDGDGIARACLCIWVTNGNYITLPTVTDSGNIGDANLFCPRPQYVYVRRTACTTILSVNEFCENARFRAIVSHFPELNFLFLFVSSS